jgi:23S rRNA pseudouridine2605 synthase
MPPRAERGTGPVADHNAPDGIRLQKVLASAGFGSRRACEELISAGRVTVNGKAARLGARVDPQSDVISLDGTQVPTAEGLLYFAINKPRGMLSTMSDDRGRSSLHDMVSDLTTQVHHVGRLDADSEGLLLLTNDGTLSHRLMHPSYGVVKTYLVEVEGVVPRAATRALRAGVELDDGVVTIDELTLVDSQPGRSVLEVSLHEGRNHVVRRVFEIVGHPVTRLVRTSVGPIRLGDLKPGRRRHLQQGEVQALYRAVDL